MSRWRKFFPTRSCLSPDELETSTCASNRTISCKESTQLAKLRDFLMRTFCLVYSLDVMCQQVVSIYIYLSIYDININKLRDQAELCDVATYLCSYVSIIDF